MHPERTAWGWWLPRLITAQRAKRFISLHRKSAVCNNQTTLLHALATMMLCDTWVPRSAERGKQQWKRERNFLFGMSIVSGWKWYSWEAYQNVWVRQSAANSICWYTRDALVCHPNYARILICFVFNMFSFLSTLRVASWCVLSITGLILTAGQCHIMASCKWHCLSRRRNCWSSTYIQIMWTFAATVV